MQTETFQRPAQLPKNINFASAEFEANYRRALANEPDERRFRPMIVITGPHASGKTRLARFLLETLFDTRPACGGCPSRPNEEWWIRHLPATLDQPYAWFDNCRRVSSDTLAKFITATEWTYRPLRTEGMVTKPCNTLVVLSGTDVVLSEELEARAVRIHLADPTLA